MIIPKTDGVTVDGVNMISWELNGDGIDVVSSRNVEICNCFIRTYDDAITLKCRFIVNPISDIYNVNIHDCLIWADYARGIVIGPEAGNINKSAGRIHHVTVKDCIFMQHKRGLDDDLRAAFAIGQGSDGQTDLWRGSNPPNTISDITASGLTFDNIDKSGRHVSIWQYSGAPVTMQNISLSDFKIIDNNANRYPALWIKTNGSYIKDLKINNFTINDTKLTGSSSQLSIDKPANVGITVN
jgi:polygalacturonase